MSVRNVIPRRLITPGEPPKDMGPPGGVGLTVVTSNSTGGGGAWRYRDQPGSESASG
jgi:hypothetical protein